MSSKLILLHGLPATGKSTLARNLAAELGWPMVSVDAFKEKLFDIMQIENFDLSWSRKFGASSCELSYLVLEEYFKNGISCIAETAWVPKFAEPKFTDFVERYQVDIIQIVVRCHPDIRKERFRARIDKDRHAVHMDRDRERLEMIDDEAFSQQNQALNIPGTLIELDSTEFDGIETKGVLEKLKERLK